MRFRKKTCLSAGFLLYECQIKHGKFDKQLGTSKQVFPLFDVPVETRNVGIEYS